MLLSGCSSIVASDIKESMNLHPHTVINTDKEIDLSKITYVQELRCYTYQADKDKDEMKSILFDETGRKIMTREAAIEYVQTAYENEKRLTTKDKVYYWSTMVWVAPWGFVFGVAENIVMIPAYPYLYHIYNKIQKEAYLSYRDGQELLTQGHYREARENFLLARSDLRYLVNQSDIDFKIAQTYDNEGNRQSAANYYKDFLEYSIALYPDFFKEYNDKLVNDRTELDKEFSIAEEKLKTFHIAPIEEGAAI